MDQRDRSLKDLAGEGVLLKFTLLSADLVHLCRRTIFTPFQVAWIGGQVEKLIGFSTEEVYAAGCWIGFVHPEDRERVLSHLERTRPGDHGSLELRMVCKDGSVRHVLESYQCEHGVNKDDILFYGSIKDITESKRHEELMIKSSTASLRILDGAPALIWRSGVNGECDWFNETWLEFTGHTLYEEITDGWHRRVHPDDLERCNAVYSRHFQERTGFEMEYRLLRHDGEHRWIVDYGRPYEDVDGNFAGFIGYCHDITDRRQAQDALAESEAKYRRLHESLMDGYAQVSMDGRLMEFNTVFQAMLGYSEQELRSLGYEDITPRKWHDFESGILDRQVLTRGFSDVYLKEYRRKDGTVFPVELRTYLLRDSRGNNVGMWAIVRDVTERQLMLERMVQTEKMMSVGGLAAGMAHEINNPLSGILQNVQLIKSRLTTAIPANLAAAGETGCDFKALQDYLGRRDIPLALESIREAGVKAAHIVTSMLDFSRKSDQFGMASVNDLIRKAINLCRTDYDLKKEYDFRRIEITTGFAEPMPDIPCNAVQIEQVFMNILQNAAQALAVRHGDGGRPAISLHTSLDDTFVQIEIEDNGPGIPPEVVSRIFEPFFTTKGPGIGTGLGLSVSYFIITSNHGGSLDVFSRPDQGTRFVIRLPLAREG